MDSNPPIENWILSGIHDKEGRRVGSMILDSSATSDSSKPWLVYVTFKYQGSPLPTQSEFDTFDKIDEQLQTLCVQYRARCVAIWTNKGIRDWIVYAVDGNEFKQTALTTLMGFRPDVKVQQDSSWNQYRDLKGMVEKAKGS